MLIVYCDIASCWMCTRNSISCVWGATLYDPPGFVEGDTHWYLVCSSDEVHTTIGYSYCAPLEALFVVSFSGPLIHERSSPRWLSYCLSTHVFIRREARCTKLHNTLAGVLINVAVLGQRHLQGGAIWRGITGDRQRNNGGAMIEATTPRLGSTVCSKE